MNSVKVQTDLFRRFASKEMTKLTLSHYYTAGRHLLKHRNSASDGGFSAFQLTANFLYRELPVRIGQTATGLRQNPSPYNIRQIAQFRALLDAYADDLSRLVDRTPAPLTPGTNEQFVDTLRRLKKRHRANMWTLSQGLRELSTAINTSDALIVPDFLRAGAAAAHAPHYYSSTMAYPALSAPMAYLAPSGKMEMTDPSAWSASASASGVADGGVADRAPRVLAPQQWAPNRVCSEFCDEATCRNPRLWFSDGTQRCAENQTRRFFDWLYSMNLGTQLLIEDHVAIHDYSHNLVQIIQPLDIASRAARDAAAICQRHYGVAPPPIKLIAPTPAVTTTYMPHYLYSMLFQLLKNALRATIDHHAASLAAGQRRALPAVKLVMSSGDEDVAFKVSDEGGGIPLSQVDAIWSYLKTSTDPAADIAEDGLARKAGARSSALSAITFMSRASDMPLFGAGDGLPMARQIARYFGGDLDLVSMEGVGTDVYLHLSRSRNVAEHTPDLSTLLESSFPVLDPAQLSASAAATSSSSSTASI
ncbi:[Pyruvate dehydrogenase (acetyl-transferring)] kinase isozyme 2 [Coemansia sp. RSA 2424]|nr:[Pyruvate dehydrogenase (acetyl-transferring)] kinase isozyme 2 [Coemansia sp. RSA 2424]